MVYILPRKFYDKNNTSHLEFEVVDIMIDWRELYFLGKPSGYMISNTGRVKNPDGSEAPIYYDKDGYSRFSLYIPKKSSII